MAVPDTLPKVGDHRVTGAVIGGVMGGTLGFLFSGWFASGSDNAADLASGGSTDDDIVSVSLMTIGGAALGVGLGYLAGKSTPKSSPAAGAPPPASIVDTGMKWQVGAGIGAVAGAVVMGYLAAADDSGDGAEGAIAAIPLGALVGAFIGGGVARE